MRNYIRQLLIESDITDDQRAEYVYQTLKEHGIELPYEIGNLHISSEDIIHATIWKDWYLEEDRELFVHEVIEPIQRITELYLNGGVLSRIVFLNDISELDTDNLGKYWIGDPFEFFAGGVKYIEDHSKNNQKHTYIIKGKIPPHAVDCQYTFDMNMMNVEEAEITILDKYIPRIKYLGYEEYEY